MQTTLNKLANYLIIMLPIFLITGPFLSDLSVVLIDLIFIYFVIKEKKFDYINNFFFKILILFNLYISIRSLFADDILFSIKSSLTYVRFTFLIFAVSFFLIRNKNLIYNFSRVFLFTIAVLFLDAVFQYIFGFNFLGFEKTNPDKLNGLFGDEGVLGSYIVRFMPLILACYLLLNKGKNKFIFLVVLCLISILIFLSGSRSSLALLILFIFIFAFIFNEYRKIIFSFLMLLSVVIISFILTYDLNKKITETIDVNKSFSSKLEYTVYYNLIDPIRTIFLDNKNTNSNSVRKNITLFTSVHESHYKTAYKMFEQNKFFGVGNKMFRKLCGNKDYYYNEYSCSTHPHNTYLQILAENGLVGIVFITTIFIYIAVILFKEFIVRNFKKIKTLDDKALLILIGIFLNLWPIIPSGNFFNNWLSILIYFPIGFLYYFNKNQNE